MIPTKQEGSVIDFIADPVQGNPVRALFWKAVFDAGMKSVIHDGWRTDGTIDSVLEENGCEVVLTNHFSDSAGAFVCWNGVPLLLEIDHGSVDIIVAAEDRKMIDALRKKLPVTEAHDSMVPFTFWMNTPHGPNSIVRRLTAADWNEIEGNYSVDTRADLLTLMEGFEPALGGQLLIWHGQPGTGKTFAIRALSWQWRDWCDFHYIADPEEFFGQAQYLLSVLLSESERFVSSNGPLPEPESAPGPLAGPRWRCLVLEDTGELLAADAKEKTGQGLSRLLNVVDGLIGQGLRILVLVTTNEELGRLHPAVLRPGRCAMNTLFGKLTADEVAEWRARHKTTGPAEPRFLAELFAEAEGFYNRNEYQQIGF